MANVYIRSLAAGTGTGADWTNAFTTLAAAFSGKAAGDSFWVSEDHAETQASAITLASPGTLASPCFVYCVNHAGTVPPVSADLRTTATISTTGANSITFTFQTTYWYGIIFSAGSAANAASIIFQTASGGLFNNYKSCGFTLNNTSSTSKFNLANTAGAVANVYLYDNCTWTFGSSTSQQFTGAGQGSSQVFIRGGSIVVGASVPAFLFSTTPPGGLFLEGVDLSAFGSGKTLIDVANQSVRTVIKDCKLGASVTVAATPASVQQRIDLIRSDSSGTNYRAETYQYTGTETVETTIVRTGGASDGTTTIAKKLVTTANSKWVLPFEALPIAIWNDSTSSVTVTVYGIWGGGAVPNNDDIWMDVEYLGSALTPQGSFATSTKANNLATASALSSDTSTWGGSTTKFKMTATFTPAQKGAIYIYLKAATASTTFYIDPKPVLS